MGASVRVVCDGGGGLVSGTMQFPKENDRGCFTVAVRAGYLVEVMPMLFNFRLVLTPVDRPDVYDAGWCYFGTGPDTFGRCVAAAAAFDPAVEADPVGFDKALQDRTVTI